MLLIGITAFLVDIFLVRPIFSLYSGLKDSIVTAEKRTERNLDFLSRKDAIYGEYEKYKSHFKSVGTEEEELASILKEIESVANATQIKLADIKPVPVLHTEFYDRYSVEIECESDMNNLVKFIYEIQHSEKMLRVDRLRITAKKTKGSVLEGYMLISRVVIP